MKNYRLFASAAAMLVVAGALGYFVLWQLGSFQQNRQWTISTGAASGNYHQLGSQLADLLNAELGPVHQFELAPSAGSAENMERIDSGTADFAFVQSNAKPSSDARLVATLYDEVLHIVVRADLVTESIASLEFPLEALGKFERVSLGPAGSGTNEVASLLLDHFEIRPPSSIMHLQVDDLLAKFSANELDAAFVLAATGSQHVEELLDSGSVRLLSIAHGPPGGTPMDAFALLNPAFHASQIPARVYGRLPGQTVQSIGVSALMVASEAADFGVVRQVTGSLFRHRNQLVVGEGTPLRLSQADSSFATSMPLHPGAAAYYHRENPSFLVVYAEVIALGITVAVGLWSLIRLFMRWLADVKKERIDEFYREVRAAAALQGDDRLQTLHAIHDRAFDQLMSERLIANESFVIFHDYLLSEIRRAERAAG